MLREDFDPSSPLSAPVITGEGDNWRPSDNFRPKLGELRSENIVLKTNHAVETLFPEKV